MLQKIDALTGQGLMRLWGVPSWPGVGGDYWLWHGVGVFVVIEKGAHVELHMAMKKGERHRCRDAVADVLALIGQREIHAPILIQSKHVCNLAKKFGFVETFRGVVDFIDGSSGELILMKRYANGRHC
jgi:hypothetical protein